MDIEMTTMKKQVVLYKKLSPSLMARLQEQVEVALIERLDHSLGDQGRSDRRRLERIETHIAFTAAAHAARTASVGCGHGIPSRVSITPTAS